MVGRAAGAVNRPAPPAGATASRTLGSVARALRVIGLLVAEPSGELGVSQVARHLGIGKSTAHQILATLLEHEFIERDPLTSRYRLGVRLVEAGAVALDRAGLGPSSRPILERLAADLDETVSLAIRAGGEVVYVQRVEATAVLRVGLRVGARMPLHALPSGWVLLAGVEPGQRRTLIEGLARSAGVAAGQIEATVDAVARDGWTIAREVPFAGISAIAVPVRDGAGAVAAALSVAGPSARFEPAQHRAAVLAAADVLSRRLGFHGRAEEPHQASGPA